VTAASRSTGNEIAREILKKDLSDGKLFFVNGKATRTIRKQRAACHFPGAAPPNLSTGCNRLTFIHERRPILFKPFAMKEKVTE
jgi:hypothetical protein